MLLPFIIFDFSRLFVFFPLAILSRIRFHWPFLDLSSFTFTVEFAIYVSLSIFGIILLGCFFIMSVCICDAVRLVDYIPFFVQFVFFLYSRTQSLPQNQNGETKNAVHKSTVEL